MGRRTPGRAQEISDELGENGAEAVPILVETALTFGDDELRLQIMHYVSWIDQKQGKELLAKNLKSKDPKRRLATVQSMGDLATRSYLWLASNDSYSDPETNAHRALLSDIVSDLSNMANDANDANDANEDAKIKEQAKEALKEICTTTKNSWGKKDQMIDVDGCYEWRR